MSGLEAGEKVAAENATAPRVTLDGMKKRVAREYYFTAGEAIVAIATGANTPPHRPSDPLDVLTICILTLDNGWTLLGKSAPASLDNFDAKKGRYFAYEDALKQLWPLEGYLLREKLHDATMDEIVERKTTARQDTVEREIGVPFPVADEPEEPLGFE